MSALLAFYFFFSQTSFAQTDTHPVDGNKFINISKTTTTLQLVNTPMEYLSSTIRKKRVWGIKNLNADYVRYAPYNMQYENDGSI